MIHILGSVAVVIDIIALWALGHPTSYRIRRHGLAGMFGVNALFGVQAVLMQNWSLLAVSVVCVVMQGRAWLHWKGGVKYPTRSSRL